MYYIIYNNKYNFYIQKKNCLTFSYILTIFWKMNCLTFSYIPTIFRKTNRLTFSYIPTIFRKNKKKHPYKFRLYSRKYWMFFRKFVNKTIEFLDLSWILKNRENSGNYQTQKSGIFRVKNGQFFLQGRRIY